MKINIDNFENSTEKETGNESIENEIKKVFQRITSGIYPEVFNTLTISEDYQGCTEILIHDLVLMISQSQVLACFILEDESGRKNIECNNRFIFENIKLYINEPQLIKEINPGFLINRFSPCVELFIRNLNELIASEIGQYLNSGVHHNYDDHHLVKFCTMFNHFFEKIKNEVNSHAFKNALNHYQD